MSRRMRSGFTLIELLVVIAIIGILATLIMAGVSVVRGNQMLTTTQIEIRELKAALENFKVKFGVYPPSQVTLPPGDVESQRILKTMWPNIDIAAAFGPTGLNVAGSSALQGDQCLVLFLGGSQDPNGGGCRGFSTSKTNPFLAGGDREQPFFKFKADRLFKRAGSPFFSYGDGFYKSLANGFEPSYAYFAPTRAAGYVDSHCNNVKDAKGNFPQPYKDAVGAYLNKQSFQIVSPGKDTMWGNARQWAAGTGVIDAASNGDSMDNIADFAAGLLSGS